MTFVYAALTFSGGASTVACDDAPSHREKEATMKAAERRVRRVLELLPSWAPRTTDGGLQAALTEVYGFDAKSVMDGTSEVALTKKFTRDVRALLPREGAS